MPERRGAPLILDIGKLEDYCLNPNHPRGRHKARVFRHALGIGRSDAAWLRQVLLNGARQGDAIDTETDAFGSRWRVDVPVTRHGRSAVVRTIWIKSVGESVSRFVTCWVL
jgi:hypothetical protein